MSPSITTIPNRELAAGADQLLLNPLDGRVVVWDSRPPPPPRRKR